MQQQLVTLRPSPQRLTVSNDVDDATEVIAPWAGGAPADDQLLVRVEACVVGGAELQALREPGRFTPGGAAVGTVEVAGANAAELANARVVVGPVDPCGECDECRRGQTSVCPQRAVRGSTIDGALCTHVLAAARWVCRIDSPLLSWPAGLDVSIS